VGRSWSTRPTSRSWPRRTPEIEHIGYHCRDYFAQQWDRLRHVPWSVLAHSTHVRGAGSYDAVSGQERSRGR
jgi:hypothetical protein